MHASEPRYHDPGGTWHGEAAPAVGSDDQNRITSTWHDPKASPKEQVHFSISFPKWYVPLSSIQ